MKRYFKLAMALLGGVMLLGTGTPFAAKAAENLESAETVEPVALVEPEVTVVLVEPVETVDLADLAETVDLVVMVVMVVIWITPDSRQYRDDSLWDCVRSQVLPITQTLPLRSPTHSAIMESLTWQFMR